MSLARGSKEAAIPGVRDQLLVALLEGGAQAVEDGSTLGRVTLGLFGVEADYVSARLASWSPVADHHFLDFELGLATARPRNDQRRHRLTIGQNDVAHLTVAAFAGAQDVFEAKRLQLGDRLGTDHPAVSNHAHAGNAEPLAQTGDHRQQRLHIGGVAGPDLRADRPAFAIEHHPDDHLMQIGTMILRLAVPTQALTAVAVEVKRGGIEQHHREIGEQATAALEQGFFDNVLGAACCASRPALIGQFFTQPAHRTIQLVQLQAVSAIDVIGLQPLLAGTIGAGDHQPMQYAGKHRALERKAEATPFGELLDHLAAAGLLPQTTEDHRRPDAPRRTALQRSCLQAGDQQGGLGEPGTRAQQRVQSTVGLQLLDTSQRGEHALDGARAIARVLDDLQVATLTGGLDAKEHAAPNRSTAILTGFLRKARAMSALQAPDVAP